MSTLSLRARRDPFFSEFDALVRSTLGTAEAGRGLAFTPAVETVREGDDVVVRLELPGVDVASDVTVEVVSGRLVVKGERRDARSEQDEDAAGRRIGEIRYGSFERTFSLPSHVTAEAVSAAYDAGILSVRVAGVHAGTEPTRIEIAS